MSENEQQQRLLQQGLAAQHVEAYMTNAWFRTAVDQLALMLPLFVDGLAAEARKRQVEMETAADVLAYHPELVAPRKDEE